MMKFMSIMLRRHIIRFSQSGITLLVMLVMIESICLQGGEYAYGVSVEDQSLGTALTNLRYWIGMPVCICRDDSIPTPRLDVEYHYPQDGVEALKDFIKKLPGYELIVWDATKEMTFAARNSINGITSLPSGITLRKVYIIMPAGVMSPTGQIMISADSAKPATRRYFLNTIIGRTPPLQTKPFSLIGLYKGSTLNTVPLGGWLFNELHFDFGMDAGYPSPGRNVRVAKEDLIGKPIYMPQMADDDLFTILNRIVVAAGPQFAWKTHFYDKQNKSLHIDEVPDLYGDERGTTPKWNNIGLNEHN